MKKQEALKPDLRQTAKLAYMAYSDANWGKSYLGNDLPVFEALSEDIQIAWEKAVNAVINEVSATL